MFKIYCSDDKQLFCMHDLQSIKLCEFNDVGLINLDRLIHPLSLNLYVDQMYLLGTVEFKIGFEVNLFLFLLKIYNFIHRQQQIYHDSYSINISTCFSLKSHAHMMNHKLSALLTCNTTTCSTESVVVFALILHTISFSYVSYI